MPLGVVDGLGEIGSNEINKADSSASLRNDKAGRGDKAGRRAIDLPSLRSARMTSLVMNLLSKTTAH
jgi:hypothetical protein